MEKPNVYRPKVCPECHHAGSEGVVAHEGTGQALTCYCKCHMAADVASDLLSALKAGLAERALNCSFSGQADDPHVCCCGKPKAYHWKAAAREAIARAEGLS